jgi:hypothetical protein
VTEERKPPPRVVTRDISFDPDEIYVPPAPDTERVPQMIPKAPRLPRTHEPFQLLKGRESSYAELSAQISEVRQLTHETLAVQRKMVLQSDHLGQIVNRRFDLFHEELSMLRATVTGDHGPRLAQVELSLGEKVKATGSVLGKGAVFTLLGGVLTEAFPQYARLLGQLLHMGAQ